MFDVSNEIPKYTKPPLNFLGNKQKWLDTIRRVLLTKNVTGKTRFLDVFGGSGLIAHNLKYWYPDNEVIRNDFDNYAERLLKIDTTNKILNEIKEYLISKGCIIGNTKGRTPKLTNEQIKDVITILDRYTDSEIDWHTISAYLKYGGKLIDNRQQFYNTIFFNKLTILNKDSKGYLKGVIRDRLDYKQFIDKYRTNDTFMIFDPPYTKTTTEGYKNCFTLKDTEELIANLKGVNWLFFTSANSKILHIFDKYDIKYSLFTKNFSLTCKGKNSNKDLMVNPL